MTDITARAYMSDSVARQLASEPLTPPEVVILMRYREAFENGRVLDLGAGSGRTTRYLASFCADYLGIDISPEMLAHARRDHPEQRFREGDIRALGELDEPDFDFVLIAYNTIDVLDHDDRLALLAAVRSIVRPGGLLVFSTHNRAWRLCGKPPRLPALDSVSDLPRHLYRTARAARAIRNHRRLAHLQRVETDYAVVTGSSARSGLVYCIDRQTQLRQLRDCNFEALDVYDIEGRLLNDEDMAVESYNLHFVCRPS
jgi:SAM-dependent methyltransferase